MCRSSLARMQAWRPSCFQEGEWPSQLCSTPQCTRIHLTAPTSRFLTPASRSPKQQQKRAMAPPWIRQSWSTLELAERTWICFLIELEETSKFLFGVMICSLKHYILLAPKVKPRMKKEWCVQQPEIQVTLLLTAMFSFVVRFLMMALLLATCLCFSGQASSAPRMVFGQ